MLLCFGGPQAGGWDCVLFVARGCGGLALRPSSKAADKGSVQGGAAGGVQGGKLTSFSAAHTGDLRHALRTIADRHPGR